MQKRVRVALFLVLLSCSAIGRAIADQTGFIENFYTARFPRDFGTKNRTEQTSASDLPPNVIRKVMVYGGCDLRFQGVSPPEQYFAKMPPFSGLDSFPALNPSPQYFIEASNGGADFTGANLKGLGLQKVTITNAKLAGADFEYSQFRDVRFVNSDLSGANFAHSNLIIIRFEHCKMPQAKFAGSYAANGGSIAGAYFRDCNLQGADFSNVDFVKGMFANCLLTRSRFTNANLPESCFVNDDLQHADFTGAFLSRSQLVTTQLTNAILDTAVADFLRSNAQSSSAKTVDQNYDPEDFMAPMPHDGYFTHGVPGKEGVLSYPRFFIEDVGGTRLVVNSTEEKSLGYFEGAPPQPADLANWYNILRSKLPTLWSPVASGHVTADFVVNADGSIGTITFHEYEPTRNRDGTYNTSEKTMQAFEDSISLAIHSIGKIPNLRPPATPGLNSVDLEVSFGASGP